MFFIGNIQKSVYFSKWFTLRFLCLNSSCLHPRQVKIHQFQQVNDAKQYLLSSEHSSKKRSEINDYKASKLSSRPVNPVVLKCQEIMASLEEENIGADKNMEYFYYTNFGKIKMDSHNELHEWSSIKAEAPDKEEKVSCKDNHNVVSVTDNLMQDRPRPSAEITTVIEKESSEFIDRQYFGDLVTETASEITSFDEDIFEHQAKKIDSLDIPNIKKENCGDFIDRQHFGVLMDRDVTQDKANMQKIEPDSFSYSKQDINNDNDLNHIDEIYFKDYEESVSNMQNTKQNAFTYSKQDINNDCNLNYIDEIYFKDSEVSNDNESFQQDKWKLELSDCMSDFERALVDVNDELTFSPLKCHPRYQLTPYTKKIEQEVVESYKTVASKSDTAMDSASTSESSLNIDGNIELSSSLVEIVTPDNVRHISASKEQIFNYKSNASNNAESSDNAYDYVVEMRRKKRQKQLEEVSPDGRVYVPRYKNIINSIWNLEDPSRDMKRLMKECLIYNENDIVAIFKPYGMRVHGGGEANHKQAIPTVLQLLPKLCEVVNAKELHHVHRLDANTTGILLLGRTQPAAERLRKMFKEHTLIKTYLTITKRVPSVLHGVIDIPLKECLVDGKRRMGLRPVIEDVNQRRHGGVKAVTKFKVLSRCDNAALLSVQPQTGVKHQIRAHLGLALASPILADHKYSSNTRIVPQKLPTDMLQKLEMRQPRVRDLPMMLHASSILLPQFVDNTNIKISCPPPPHFLRTMKALKLNSRRNITDLKSLDYVDLGTDLV